MFLFKNILNVLFNIFLSANCSKSYRDCIILFTDGQANVGITDAKQLVQEYKFRTDRMGKTNGIPVSAITIGDNEPFFLNQVHEQLFQ